MSSRCFAAGLGAALLLALASQPAAAGTLTLTPAGIADGFTLTTFATLDPGNTGCCTGPFGLAVAANGNVIVANNMTSSRYAFADVDGQTIGTALFTQSVSSSTVAYAHAGGQAYGGQNGKFVQLNNDGSVNHVLTGVTASPYLGMWGSPTTGHIIATSSQGVIDIDPLANGGAGSFTVLNGGLFGDGITVSPDGKTGYIESGGNIYSFNVATGAVITGYSGFSAPDGTGVISSSNQLNGDVIVNNNFGEVDLLNPTTSMFTAIATGGTRGDYVSPDTNNGTLFMDFSDVVERLSCGPNCSIGGPPPQPVPEPAPWSLFGLGLLGAALALRRRIRFV